MPPLASTGSQTEEQQVKARLQDFSRKRLKQWLTLYSLLYAQTPGPRLAINGFTPQQISAILPLKNTPPLRRARLYALE